MRSRSKGASRPVARSADLEGLLRDGPGEGLATGGSGQRSMAYQVLLGMGRRRLGPAAPLIAGRILADYGQERWELIEAAFEAALRRAGTARGEGLRVARRPGGGRALGEYRTRRPGRGGLRPWRTVLRSVEPLEASCDCPDFRRASLGVCKHVVAVLRDLTGRPRRMARARAEEARGQGSALLFAPMRPVTGEGDPLGQLRFQPGRGRRPGFCRGWAEGADGLLRPTGPGRAGAAERLARVAAMDRWLRRRGAGAGDDPAAVAFVAEERARLEALEAARGGAARAMAALGRLRRPLYPYQHEGVARFVRSGRLLLADDMGLGKTVQAIAGCHGLRRAGLVRRGLLVVPASLRAQWQWEWESFTDVPLTVVDGLPESRRALYEGTEDGFLVVSYATLRRDVEHLRRWDPEVVVLDEAQRIKNWETKTAHAVKRLDPAYRLVLTGTPLENRLGELASVMDWVHGPALEPKWRLEPAHADEEGARELGTLRQRIAPHMLRRRRSEILSQLPPRTDSVVPVELGSLQRELHDELNRPIARLVAAARRRPLRPEEHTRLMSLLNRQRIIANGVAQVRFEGVFDELPPAPTARALASLGSPKLLELRELVRRLVVDQGRKVVVFSQWRRMLRLAEWAVRDVLAPEGMRAVFFTGAESGRQRTRSLVAFHDDRQVPILFASDAGGVGLNLQKAASCCIQLEVPWNPAVFEQRVARIHRLGQDEPIDVVTLVSRECIEERIAGLVGNKRALFDGLFDSDSDEIAYEQSGTLVSRLGDTLDPVLVAEAAPAADPGPGVDAPAADAGPGVDAPAEGARDVAALFTRVHLERREDGGLRLEADPDAAAELRAMFEGMARLLGAP